MVGGVTLSHVAVLAQMRKFVVPKNCGVKVDVEQARVERAAVMSWPPPLKKRRAHTSCPFILANMAEVDVARFVVGNDSGMCKAALSGDDALSVFPSRIRLNRGKPTRSRHSKDCQIHSILLMSCVAVHGLSELELVFWLNPLPTETSAC